MKDAAEALADDLEDFIVGGHIRPRKVLLANEDRFHRLGRKQLPNAFVSCDGYCHVGGMCEPVGVDDRGVRGVGRGDVNGPSR